MSDITFDALLTQTCAVSRRTLSTTDDVYGAAVESFTVISTAEPCLMEQMEETVEFTRRGKKIQARYLGFLKFTANIQEDDLITFNGKKYIVLCVDNAAGQNHHYEIFIGNLEN